MRLLDLIVIHCTATKAGVDYDVATVRRWHLARGFRNIGYHMLIHLDGSIEKGRPLEQSGAHAKGYNSHSVGICYVGGLDAKGKPSDTRTVAQVHALRRVVEVLEIIYKITEVVGHRDLSVDLNADGRISEDEWMKACPCFNMSEL